MNRLLIVISTVVFMAALLNGGTALFMDGDGDFIKLFEPIVDQAPFTVEGWAMMAGPGGGLYAENCLFEQRNRETTFGAATVTLLAKNAHQDEASFELRDSESDRIKLAGSIQSFQEWHHYAGVVDNEKITFYIDGIVVNFVNYHFTGAFNTGIDNLSIGRHAYLDIVAGYFNGYIDELRIWDTARSEQQIRDGMFATVDLNDEEEASHLLAYWRFDDFYEFLPEVNILEELLKGMSAKYAFRAQQCRCPSSWCAAGRSLSPGHTGGFGHSPRSSRRHCRRLPGWMQGDKFKT